MAANHSPSFNNTKLPEDYPLQALRPINLACERRIINQHPPQTSSTKSSETRGHACSFRIHLEIVVVVFTTALALGIDEITADLHRSVGLSKSAKLLRCSHCNPAFQTLNAERLRRLSQILEYLECRDASNELRR